MRLLPPVLVSSIFSTLGACIGACGDSDGLEGPSPRPDGDTHQPEADVPRPPPVAGRLYWERVRGDDPVITIVLATPDARPRGFGDPDVLRVEVRGDVEGVAQVARETGEVVAVSGCDSRDELFGGGLIVDCALADEPFREGEVLLVDVELSGGTHTLRSTVPTPPPERPSAIHALSGYDDGEVVWLGTPYHGLVGLGGGEVIRHPGVPTVEDYDPAYRGPQSSAILAVEPDPDGGGLWLASAATGLSWFDPGEERFSPSDDVWRHSQPRLASTGVAEELAQTAVALAPVDDGVWAATMNGLWKLTWPDRSAEPTWRRVVGGAALAVAVDGQRVWAGFSTQVAARLAVDPSAVELVEQWPQAQGALAVLDPATVDAAPVRWALPDEPAVTALLARDGMWVGTTRGLLRADMDDGQVELVQTGLVPDGLAVVHLAWSASGLWVAARDECGVRPGLLMRVRLDDGAVVGVDTFESFPQTTFSFVRERGDGQALVSTLVPGLGLVSPEQTTASGCEPPPAKDLTADFYLLDPRDGAVRLVSP